MWQRTVWRKSAPSASTRSRTSWPSRNQPGRCTIRGRPVRSCARAAPRKDFCSSGVNSGGNTDFANQADLDARTVHTFACFKNDLVGDLINAEARDFLWMGGSQIIARPQYDVEPGRLRNAFERKRIAANALTGRFHHRVAASACEILKLRNGQRFVISVMLCLFTKGSWRSSPRIFHADETFRQILPLRRFRRMPPAPAVVEDVLVHQRDAKLFHGTGPRTVIT